MRYAIRLAALLCCALAALLPAEARRVALVIGNADYRIGRLANPVNDAMAVAEVLEKQLRLDKVILRKNLSLDGLRAALREMARESAGAELGLIYFAGHGIEVGGRNFLVPTDAALETARDVKLEAIELDTVLEHLEGVAKLRLVILDACRNNPFPATKRGGTRGLGRIEPGGGTLVAYAAKEGTTADDGHGGRHSPFTSALLKRVVMPGVDVRRVFGYISDDVLVATGRAQEPHLYGRLGGDEVHLVPKAKGSDPAGLTPGQPVLPPAPPSAAAPADLAWAAVKDSDDIPALETFRQHYGKDRPVYDRLAALRIKGLTNQRLALLKAEEEKKRDPALSVTPGSGQSFRDRTADGAPCPECPELVVVPAGSFTMGSPPREEGHGADEGPQRRVTIARPFAVGRFEVTFDEWGACVSAGGCRHSPKDEWGRGKQPVINISWDDITKEYLPWLSRRTGKSYRLLTEAEWEYVARAGTSTPFWWGASISPSQANYDGNYTYGGGPKGNYRKKTMPVDSFAPNPWGLYNVHGNVWEWVQDCWNDSYNGAPLDGSAWTTGDCSRRVLRGGSWLLNPQFLRAALRNWNSTDFRDGSIGFRVGRTL